MFGSSFRRALVATALSGFALSASAATNLFVNPGFEAGSLTGWITNAHLDNTQAHTGNFSASGISYEYLSQDFTPTAVAQISDLSFWARRDGGLFDSVQFRYSDGSTQNHLVNTIGGSSAWTQINLTSQLQAGKSLSGFLIYGTSPGPAYFDDFQLISAVPEAETYAMLLAGLGALGLISRRRKAALTA